MQLLLVLFMEEAKEETMSMSRRPRKLDFNLPLLSTRPRGLGGQTHTTADHEVSCLTSSQIAAKDASERVPFCWEQAPGKLRIELQRNDDHEGETPRPRLPPCRWRPDQNNAATQEVCNNDEDLAVISVDVHDDGCDADIEDEHDPKDKDEVLSLTEAIDIAQKAEEDLERLNVERVKCVDSESKNFMIERFLPDATALAASSALYALDFNDYGDEYGPRTGGGKSYCSDSSDHNKGCGLEVLFPWRMKHKLCGVKSPARQVAPSLKIQHCIPRQKKSCKY